MSPTPAPASRDFDIVLFGASGFTGALVAEYLARKAAADAEPGLRWALAGRDLDKLAAVRARLAALPGAAALAELPLLRADSRDRPSLQALCERARVVCTTVGPYALHGRDLAAACVTAGSDYCDLTGEVPFIRDLIDQHHDEAVRRGVRLVPGCGFDSIPSDLGVYLLGEGAREQGDALAAARFYLGAARGGFSGGTAASMVNLVAEARRDRRVARLLRDPYALCPGGEGGPDRDDTPPPGWDAEAKRFVGPFVMAAVNSRVVRRSNMLRGYPFGRGFRYREATLFSGGPGGLARAVGLTAALGGGLALLATPLRPLLARALPQSGEGPSAAQRAAGFFRVHLLGELRGGGRIYAQVVGTADPGYGETAKMLGESALCLARDPRGEGAAGGVLTPSVAMGDRLLTRLRAAGMTFALTPTLL